LGSDMLILAFLGWGKMTLIVLAVICLLACSFLLFVLFEWVLDAKRRSASHAAGDSDIRERLEGD